jgi:hypothetical protein
MCSHLRIKFDQFLNCQDAEKHPAALRIVYELLQKNMENNLIQQKVKRTSPRHPNPFLFLAAATAADNDDESEQEEEEDVTIVATYFDATNQCCKRIFSNGPDVRPQMVLYHAPG